jgi:hypothetical protein
MGYYGESLQDVPLFLLHHELQEQLLPAPEACPEVEFLFVSVADHFGPVQAVGFSSTARVLL